MSLLLIRGAVEQGLLFSLTALGLFLSFRTLNIADMTVDGSFTLGAAVSATLVTLGHPFLALFCAVLAGSLAGLVSALLQTRLRIQSILAGIITMTGLYSVNLRVMGGRSNVTLLRLPTVFTCVKSALPAALQPWSRLAVAVAVSALCGILLVLFLRTRLGLSIRATGDNPAMVSASSINPQRTITVGLCVANALPALSGALVAQYQQFCDITMGTGMVVIGLASLIIGEVIAGVARRPSVPRGVAAARLGGAVYWIIIAAAISSSISANDLKLLSALIVAVAISWPVIIARVKFQMKKKANRSC
ncbi:MAG: ABC transporter permease [Pyramidobacter sp.]|jgi:putative ABC transport system permease protein